MNFLDVLLGHGWGLYLMISLIVYDIQPWNAQFWIIYVPTAILVIIAKVWQSLKDKRENDGM